MSITHTPDEIMAFINRDDKERVEKFGITYPELETLVENGFALYGSHSPETLVCFGSQRFQVYLWRHLEPDHYDFSIQGVVLTEDYIGAYKAQDVLTFLSSSGARYVYNGQLATVEEVTLSRGLELYNEFRASEAEMLWAPREQDP